MSAGDDEWDAVFASTSEPDRWAPLDFKWGWNAETSEPAVWRIAGGADGVPLHEWYLTEAWGRRPSYSVGDVLGIATATNTDHGSEDPSVTITPFYGTVVPDSVVEWFKAELPGHAIKAVTRMRSPGEGLAR